MDIPKERIIGKLNQYSRQALEQASQLCMEQGAYEVTTGHMLYALLDQNATDCKRLISHTRLDEDALKEDLRKSFEMLRRGAVDLPQFSPLLIELLKDAWMLSSAELEAQTIRTGAILVAMIRGADRYVNYHVFDALHQVDVYRLVTHYDEFTKGSMESETPNKEAAQASAPAQQGGESALGKFGRNLTDLAKEGKIDPVFCRDDEIGLMTDVLSRRRKNNPILVGDPGVGKTAVAEGLALKITEGDVPPALADVELWELDLGALQAGASVSGEFERRLKMVIDEVTNAPQKIVLFIDEAHALIGAGGQAGGSDAANLLKPALARGELRAIAATTWSEYKKYFEKDAALSRRFQLIKLDEPSVEDAVVILRGLRDRYEDTHGVYISDAALQAAASLSARYLAGRQLPDSALDVLDTASVRVSAALSTKPKSLVALERAIALEERTQEAQDRDQFMRAGQAEAFTGGERLARMREEAKTLQAQWEDEKAVVEEILQIRHELHENADALANTPDELKSLHAKMDEKLEALRVKEKSGEALIDFEVGVEAVARVISDWTGVPASAMSGDEAERIMRLGDVIRASIKGQDEAVEIIHNQMKTSRLDMTRENQPRGVFLLVGTSGVGKTETALRLADELYGGKDFITTINMSEYQEKHSVSRLIGSPPGYVGYGEGGVLSEAIRKKPYSVVLLDEIEKAHPDILNLFFGVFDKGELFDGEGREIDCKNVVFFMTSNLGSEALMQNPETVKNANLEQLFKALRPHIEEHIKPALIARMKVVVYKPLDDETMQEIVHLKLNRNKAQLAKRQKLELEWDDAVEKAVLGLCTHAENGARMVDQVIERWILPPIAEERLMRMVAGQDFDKVIIHAAEGGFGLEFLPDYGDAEAQSEATINSEPAAKEKAAPSAKNPTKKPAKKAAKKAPAKKGKEEA